MTENKTEKSRWAAPLRVLAMVLEAALLLSLAMPTAIGVRSTKDSEEAQTLSDADRYSIFADLAIAEEKYPEAAGYLEKLLEMSDGMEEEELAQLCLKTASVYVMCVDRDRANQFLDRTL